MWDHEIMKEWVRKGKSKRQKWESKKCTCRTYLENISQPFFYNLN